MRAVEFSPQAKADLREIWLYIAQDNVTAADAMIDALTRRAADLGSFPHLGHIREDFAAPPLRFLAEGAYHIVYHPDTDPLQILRILSAHRDIPSALHEG